MTGTRIALAPARKLLVRALQLVLASLLTSLILLEVVQVTLRYLFSSGFIWGRDVATLLLFSIAWLGAPLGWLRARHIAVDLFPGLRTGRRVMAILIDGTAFIFSLVLLVFLADAYEAFSFMDLPSLGVAASVKFLPIFAGTVLLAIAAALDLLAAAGLELKDID